MAILDTLKKKGTTRTAKKAAPRSARAATQDRKGLTIDTVIHRPRVTEKAAIIADDNGAYTFVVDPRAQKADVARAIKSIYDVVPERIRIINTKPKKVQRRNVRGVKSGFKKAIVFLKKGDKIEFV